MSTTSVPIPSEEEVFGWLLDLYSFGRRIPGSEADLKAERYLRDKLMEFGFENVSMEPIDVTLWLAKRWELEVRPEGGEAARLPCFYVPYSAPTSGLEGELVYVGEGQVEDFDKVDVEGKVVMVSVRFPPLPVSLLRSIAYFTHDPRETITPNWVHPATWIRLNCMGMGLIEGGYDAYEIARERGAIGFIGVLEDYPKLGDELTYYAPYDGVMRPLPGVWVSKETGAKLKDMLDKGRVRARIVLEAEIRPSVTHNVYGLLPGKTDEVIIVHSHHDGPFQSAVEDASGCSVVLALAKHFAQLARLGERMNRTLLFLFTAGHFYGGAQGIGQRAFIEVHKDDLMKRALIDICVEHVAKECIERDGAWVVTEEVEPRAIFTNDNPVLVEIVKNAIVRNGVERILVLPTNTPIDVPTDAHLFWKSGIPIYSLISGPVYLFDASDTPDKVAKDQLPLLTKMFADVIEELDAIPAEKIRPEGNKARA